MLTRPASELTDDELFLVLDEVSEELKRRNNILMPPISDIKNQDAHKTASDFVEALAALGIQVKNSKT